IGDADSRKEYNEALVKHFEPVIGDFCSDCQSRLHTNPMRILDCKVDKDKEAVKTAPRITEFLNAESTKYYDEVKQHLDNLNIRYEEDPNLVRGLDYYTHTAFELMIDNPNYDGAITTLCGGGRYNGLLELLGGPNNTGIGFALSIERLLLALEDEGIELDVEDDFDLFIVTMGHEADNYAVKLLNELRHNGVKADKDYLSRKVKGQMKQADRLQANYTIVIGDQELENNEIDIKDMATGNTEKINLDEVVAYFKKKE
ncbi:histidine--tRNA ligase, partial [Staphylococcus arlettae]